MHTIFWTSILLLTFLNTSGQSTNNSPIDSLKFKDYEYLEHAYNTSASKSQARIYATTWLNKAKSEKNNSEIILAYKAMMYEVEKESRLSYADSILKTAFLTQDPEEIGAAFLTKGTAFYDFKNYNAALDNYISAHQYISKTDNVYLKQKTKYTIAQTKMYLGFYTEAVTIFKEITPYFQEENDRAYLNTIHSLGLCYNKLKRYDLCSMYNGLGIQRATEYEIPQMIPYFKHSEGINQYFLANYKTAKNLLNESLTPIKNRKDFANETVALFYLGMCYWKENQKETALQYFIKVDDKIKKHDFARVDLRESFEKLISHYKKENNWNKELYYVNRLLHMDSILHNDYKYLSVKVHKEYDTPKLLDLKNDIEQQLFRNKIIFISTIVILIIIVGLLISKHFKNEKQYKQKFDELMARDPKKINATKEGIEDKNLGIAPELVETILKNLEKFECNKRFIDKDMTTGRLAELLHTNSKYISQIIPKYRGRKVIVYISDLKIEYIIELLKTEKKYRNYTNKALAEKAGFRSTQNFTKAFNSRTGISPTYFIKALSKAENN